MIIAFSGVQCSGKTTVATLLTEYLKMLDYDVFYLPSITRYYIKELKLDLKELRKSKEGTKIWQYFTLKDFIDKVTELILKDYDFIILDRWIYDYYVYTKITIDEDFLLKLKLMFMNEIDYLEKQNVLRCLCFPFEYKKDDVRDESTLGDEIKEFYNFDYNLYLNELNTIDRLSKVVKYVIK